MEVFATNALTVKFLYERVQREKQMLLILIITFARSSTILLQRSYVLHVNKSRHDNILYNYKLGLLGIAYYFNQL